jgi:hypothetical protein
MPCLMAWVGARRFSRSGDFGIHVGEELGAHALLAFASTL